MARKVVFRDDLRDYLTDGSAARSLVLHGVGSPRSGGARGYTDYPASGEKLAAAQ